MRGLLLLWVGILPGGDPPGRDAGADTAAATAVEISEGRTTPLRAIPLVGRPIESLAAPESAYALAVAKDRDQRWSEATNLYRVAYQEWTHQLSQRPSADLENARHKAGWERAQSERLGSQQQMRIAPPQAFAARIALERANLYRLKMMTVRATTGAVSPALFRRARDGYAEALRLASAEPAAGPQPAQPKPAGRSLRAIHNIPEIRILLAATLAAGGDREAARLEMAHVRQADRDNPAHALAMAIYHAATGDLDSALGYLDTAARRPDSSGARHLYFQNDWDRLRGTPRFERLFGR